MPRWQRWADCGHGVSLGSWWSCESMPDRSRGVIHIQSPGVPCRCTNKKPSDLEIEALEQRPLGRDVIEAVAAFLRKTPRVFIHCNAGQCRAPTVAALCLMLRGLNATDAKSAVRNAMMSQYEEPTEPAFFDAVFEEMQTVINHADFS